MSWKALSISMLIMTVGPAANSQEFNCQVSVIAPQIQSTPPRIWKSMETAILELMNNRRWTDRNYTPEERIEVNLLLTINEQSGMDRFSGKLQVTYARPVFGTDYNTPVIDLIDNDVDFTFLENTQIDFSVDRYQNNLASILGFYAYFILGLDGDTFSQLGGSDMYATAQQIVTIAQGASSPGWKAFEGNNNRYWLVDNQLQAVFRPLRECLYTYHRMGMDNMHSDIETSRQEIMDAIERLRTVHQAKPASYNMQVFFNAKNDELVELFKPVPTQDKSRLFTTLQIIDPGNISKYQNMMRGS
ncbi:MAG: DUF4835 family protein [Flavobacteriales bacterium]|nr:DUF4835 family protein [Flavobacteriales bacterium]